MQQWIVGGAPRDILLNQEPNDLDHVWTGTTPKDLEDMQMSRVGADFPVYLHPITGDEHALARTERKSSTGYNGFECQFDPSITIEEDLVRRDLTINSLAVRFEDWEEFKKTKNVNLVVDPYNGVHDLHTKTLRHVSEAFKEDPLRVLRTARFASKFVQFNVHPDTMVLMKSLVDSGEVDNLTRERVWKEFERAVMEKYAHRFFQVLIQCGAWNRIMPEIPITSNEMDMFTVAMVRLQVAAHIKLSLEERIALLSADIKDPDMKVRWAKNLKIPSDVFQHIGAVHCVMYTMPNDIKQRGRTGQVFLDFVKSMKTDRDTERFKSISMLVDKFGAFKHVREDFYLLKLATEAVKHVNFESLSVSDQETLKGKEIGEAIDRIKINVIDDILVTYNI